MDGYILLTKRGCVDNILTWLMALFDIFKKGLPRKAGKKRKADEKLKRPSKGALKEVEKAAEEPEKEEIAKEGKSELASRVILFPHITEKTTLFSEKGVYSFRVSPKANKIMIKQSIREMYGFDPRKIRIINVPSKTRSLRGKKGVKPGYKKALVYLKEGDKIEIA
jgi:large subunit ribosomal protein L23